LNSPQRDIKPHSSLTQASYVASVCCFSVAGTISLKPRTSYLNSFLMCHRTRSHHLISQGMGYQEIIHPFSKLKMKDLHYPRCSFRAMLRATQYRLPSPGFQPGRVHLIPGPSRLLICLSYRKMDCQNLVRKGTSDDWMTLFTGLPVIGYALRPSKVLDVTLSKLQKLGRRGSYRDGFEGFQLIVILVALKTQGGHQCWFDSGPGPLLCLSHPPTQLPRGN